MTTGVMEIDEIMKYLPHRYPFLLVDRVISIVKGQSLIAIKNVTVNEPFFQGHFPGAPIMPGVLMLEGLAQACGILANVTEENGFDYMHDLSLFAGIDNARFKHMVVPGDQLQYEVEFVKTRQGISKFTAVATVDGKIACSAELMHARRGGKTSD